MPVDMTTMYKVIKPYPAYLGEIPFLLPVGVVLGLWKERNIYVTHYFDGYCVPVERWAVECWKNYFEPIEEITEERIDEA